jgi:hypothetical protein
LIRGAAPGTKFISNLKQSERPAMATHTKWFGVAVLALTACPVLAQQGPAVSNVQFMGRGASQSPGLGTFNPGFQALNFGAGNPYAAALSTSPYAAAGLYDTPYANSPGLYGNSPYGAAGAYGNNGYSPYGDPYGGGLQGAAAAIDSQGRFMVMWQQSRQLDQQVERSKIETRRKIYDEWLYERSTRPTLEDERERSQAYELRRILHHPPTVDVVSGYALNTLLKDIGCMPGYANGPAVALDPNVVQQVNVTSRENGGNVGLLKFVKDGAGLPWPLPLQGSAYQQQTKRLDDLTADAINMVRNNGGVDAATLRDLREYVTQLKGMVSANINDLAPSQAVEAKRFLNQLDHAILALKQQNVANYFTDRWAAKGKTVADLVAYMNANGLAFAPAVSGDEAAYAALYNALAEYHRGLKVEVARDGGMDK